MSPAPYLVALTGGIGSGKSTIAGLFGALGVPVIDADAVAHALTAPAGSALDSIARTFGSHMIDASGGMDRARMRTLVFEDPRKKQQLEEILHPMIRTDMDAAIENVRVAGAIYAMLEVPLLFETMAFRQRVQRTLVVDCSRELQRQRVQHRSGLTVEEVDVIMATQVDRATRLQLADDIVANSGEAELLSPQVNLLHSRYQTLATK